MAIRDEDIGDYLEDKKPESIFEGVSFGGAKGVLTAPLRLAEKEIKNVSRNPAAIGAMAGGALGMAAGGPAGGVMGALRGAAFSGAGAMAGESIAEELSTGDIKPKTVAKRGLEAATTDMLMAGTFGAGKHVLKKSLVALDQLPSMSVNRFIERLSDFSPNVRKILGNRERLDLYGAKLVKEIQDGIEFSRKKLGGRVGAAASGLDDIAGGPSVDLRGVVDAYADSISKISPDLRPEMKSEISALDGLVKRIARNPNKTADEAIQIRRHLDSLTKFDASGVPKVGSEPGKKVIADMAQAIRSALDDAADRHNYPDLKFANEEFHREAALYDEASEVFRTKSQTPKALLEKMKKLGAEFQKGPAEQKVISDIIERLPNGKETKEELFDVLATRPFEKEGRGSPSSPTLRTLSAFFGPGPIGKTIRAAHALKVAPATKAATVGTVTYSRPLDGSKPEHKR